jgi:transcriptional accessory protein Tex/SPT6
LIATFVKSELCVKVGDIVSVKVLEVDVPRNRIQLTMRLNETASPVKNASQPIKKSVAPKQAAAPNASLAGILQAALAKKESKK